MSAVFLFAATSEGSEPAPLRLGLPIDCRLGTDCWLVNLVDLDPSKGVKDYLCQRHSYNGHKGIDIAIRDLRAMEDGMPVIAAASGTVKAFRDGMADQPPTPEFRKTGRKRYCGNGVVVDHPGGWQTQYCHLRKGSIALTKGQAVRAGDRLGYVGHSGMAKFPHVHLSVRHQGKVVDPFLGLEKTSACGLGAAALWTAPVLQQLTAPLSAIYNAGFAPTKPKVSAVRKGLYKAPALSRRSPALVFWADIFWVRAGDRLTMTITGPDAAKITERANVLPKSQARRIIFAGRKKKGLFWPAGTYTGHVVLERHDPNRPTSRFELTRKVVLKD